MAEKCRKGVDLVFVVYLQSLVLFCSLFILFLQLSKSYIQHL